MLEWPCARSEQRILVRPSDLDRSRRFYRDVLDLAIFREFGPQTIPVRCSSSGRDCLKSPGTRAGPGRPSVMIWIQVRDVHAEHARLAADAER